MELQQRIKTKQKNWAAKIRFFVGQTCTHDGAYWQNITGRNSEPSASSVDWVFVGLAEPLSNRGKTIQIEGNTFDYRPLPNNDTGEPVAGDIACNGWISQTRFGLILVYVSGDFTSIASWDVHSEL